MNDLPLFGDFIISASSSMTSLALRRLDRSASAMCASVVERAYETPHAGARKSQPCVASPDANLSPLPMPLAAKIPSSVSLSLSESGVSADTALPADAQTRLATTSVMNAAVATVTEAPGGSATWIARESALATPGPSSVTPNKAPAKVPPAAPVAVLPPAAVAGRLVYMTTLSRRMQERVTNRGRRPRAHEGGSTAAATAAALTAHSLTPSCMQEGVDAAFAINQCLQTGALATTPLAQAPTPLWLKQMTGRVPESSRRASRDAV